MGRHFGSEGNHDSLVKLDRKYILVVMLSRVSEEII